MSRAGFSTALSVGVAAAAGSMRAIQSMLFESTSASFVSALSTAFDNPAAGEAPRPLSQAPAARATTITRPATAAGRAQLRAIAARRSCVATCTVSVWAILCFRRSRLRSTASSLTSLTSRFASATLSRSGTRRRPVRRPASAAMSLARFGRSKKASARLNEPIDVWAGGTRLFSCASSTRGAGASVPSSTNWRSFAAARRVRRAIRSRTRASASPRRPAGRPEGRVATGPGSTGPPLPAPPPRLRARIAGPARPRRPRCCSSLHLPLQAGYRGESPRKADKRPRSGRRQKSTPSFRWPPERLIFCWRQTRNRRATSTPPAGGSI